MRNRIFGWIMTVGFVAGGGEVAAQEPLRQGPQEEGVVLRFDEARRDTLADVPSATAETLPAAAGRPFAYKLNRRRVTREEAYGRVTLWNVRRVRVKNRRMRLADTTRRERVRLLKFFVERDRRKGVRPHLQGNVAGYRWSATSLEGARQRRQAVHIRTYTLRAEYESLRRAGGIEVPGRVFQFIDGLILRSLDIRTDSATIDGRPLVVGRTYADRAPLVVIDGMPSDVGEWLRMCRANVFSLEAEVPMYYYYLLPVEAVETFGRRGWFGAVCIEPAR